ncbi:MAG: hypothetical protein K0S30_301 [Clostridia bacterium]|nr:hypothetical protein [Clostridia bacterium]
MAEHNRYCLKEGRLELSILEEESIVEPSQQDVAYIELDQAAAGSEGVYQPLQEVELKVSEEIYNTLKTMGKFLTQSEEVPKQNTHNEEAVPEVSLGTDKNTVLSQYSIDKLLEAHFGETTSRFKYAEELKRKIEIQIKKIKAYK